MVCATFNLGIGLIDGVCDGDLETGERLLHHLHAADLINATRTNRGRGWLRDGLTPALADDPSAAFTVDVVESFFETLHRVYPEDTNADVRRTVGDQMAVALEAESRSVGRPLVPASRQELIECSRATSVLPFEIIETLATAGSASTTGRLVGEAMWWIDDLVDLCDDTRRGTLNGVLLSVTDNEPGKPGIADLKRLLVSGSLAAAADRAAASLHAGLLRAVTTRDRNAFLQFVQRYAGLPPL